MKNITITFTEAETGVVLKALSRQPFSDVYAIIEKIVKAGHEQIVANAPVKKASVKKAPARKATRKK
jgi:hypothetical protein